MKAFTTARLGSNMEIRYMPDGTAVGQVSLAVRLGIKDKTTGEYKTQWISASLFGKRADSLAPYLLKGSLHAFHLRDLHIDEFVGKDGEKRVSMKATIDDVELCGKPESSEPARQPSSKEYDSNPPGRPGGSAAPAKDFSDMPDDIPF